MLAPCFSLVLFFASWALCLVGPSRMGSGQIMVARIKKWVSETRKLNQSEFRHETSLRASRSSVEASSRVTWENSKVHAQSQRERRTLAGSVGAPNGFWKRCAIDDSKGSNINQWMFAWLALPQHGEGKIQHARSVVVTQRLTRQFWSWKTDLCLSYWNQLWTTFYTFLFLDVVFFKWWTLSGTGGFECVRFITSLEIRIWQMEWKESVYKFYIWTDSMQNISMQSLSYSVIQCSKQSQDKPIDSPAKEKTVVLGKCCAWFGLICRGFGVGFWSPGSPTLFFPEPKIRKNPKAIRKILEWAFQIRKRDCIDSRHLTAALPGSHTT